MPACVGVKEWYNDHGRNGERISRSSFRALCDNRLEAIVQITIEWRLVNYRVCTHCFCCMCSMFKIDHIAECSCRLASHNVLTVLAVESNGKNCKYCWELVCSTRDRHGQCPLGTWCACIELIKVRTNRTETNGANSAPLQDACLATQLAQVPCTKRLWCANPICISTMLAMID